jgi:hypothetical protein
VGYSRFDILRLVVLGLVVLELDLSRVDYSRMVPLEIGCSRFKILGLIHF